MLRPTLVFFLGAGLTLASPLDPLPARQESAADQEHEPSELEQRMEAIENAVKRLRRSLRDDANREESLALVVEMERAALDCKALVPRRGALLEGEELAQFTRAYRRTMVDLLSAQLDLEAALLDGDAEGTKAAFARVRDMEDSGHELFSDEE